MGKPRQITGRARPLATTLLLLSCLNCGRSAEPADPGLPRLSRPQPHPTQGAPWDPRGVRFWIAGCNVGEDLWKYREESTTVWCDPRGRELEGTEGRFDWPVYMAVGEIRQLIVDGEGLDSVEWRFWWGLDEAFSIERSMTANVSSAQRVDFEVGSEPAWLAETRHLLRLRLTWSGTPAPGSRVLTARGER